MSTHGHVEVVGINGIDFVDNGKSLRLEIIETIPPHSSSYLTFKGVCISKLFQVGGDEFPLTVIDLTWQEITERDKAIILSKHGFPFLDENYRMRVPQARLLAAHLEGDLVGDIIAEEVVVEPALAAGRMGGSAGGRDGPTMIR